MAHAGRIPHIRQAGTPLLSSATERSAEFHIRGDVRDKYDFDESLFWSNGNVIFADFQAIQQFSERFNSDRPDHLKISPAELNAAALMDEMMHHAIARYRETVEPGVMERALAELEDALGRKALDHMLVSFVSLFPNSDVHRSRKTPEEYLSGTTGGISNTVLTLEELLVNQLSNENPAFGPFADLIGNHELASDPVYESVLAVFSSPPKSPLATTQSSPISLVEMLRKPFEHAPYSLTAQLVYVADAWGLPLTDAVRERIARGTGFIAEEERAFEMKGFAGGPGPIQAPAFSIEPEEENFSPDVDWMPNVIMVAKNALVWLDQLSKKYGRDITRLDQIPEPEIVQLSNWGFNALWLIGVWQRSEASKTLKQWTGNPEAAPSAYSLFDYVIAEELGGEEAVHKFGLMCQTHGIRLASDMVPNHTGIDSKWIREHPDWFIQLPYPPYPSYSYSGESVGAPDGPILQIEDGYFDRSDAAVTFRYQDRTTGQERFVYHGNDGTGMAWNDTAQLDFARADVREAVVQTILHVARLFPIIRFDAAMVLTKKHFHRLWYPEPGSGEGVPSRVEKGITRAQFDERMPDEFWREVVDRVAAQQPDTLLLAEAFWLLEGYFVRTLGMHRVYNSAFMHMLMQEENAAYKDVIRKTVAFEPEILKRYVNFMSNPDEETAIEQFGDHDKYFGVCLLMLTLPGLPMLAHGQVEGLREKYGMEYRRAYLDEQPRLDLIERYEREIRPIAAKRYIFSEVEHFRLFDLEQGSGAPNDDVFAFSNRSGTERALVLYNNRSVGTTGKVHWETHDPDRAGKPISIVEGLDLALGPDDLVTFRDRVSGLQYVVTGQQLNAGGLPVQLRGYEYRVMMDFAVVADDDERTLTQLANRLGGAGVRDIEESRTAAYLKPVVDLLADVVLAAFETHPRTALAAEELLVGDRIGLDPAALDRLLGEAHAAMVHLSRLPNVGRLHPWRRSSRYRRAVELASSSLAAASPVRSVLVARQLAEVVSEVEATHVSGILAGVLAHPALMSSGDTAEIIQMADSVAELTRISAAEARPIERFIPMISSDSFRAALGVHEFADTVYFGKERFETVAAATFCDGILPEITAGAPGVAKRVAAHFDAYRRLVRLMRESDYTWTSFQKRIKRIRRLNKRPHST